MMALANTIARRDVAGEIPRRILPEYLPLRY
jgi:hypothetical protein